MSNLQTFIDRMRYWCDEGNLGYDQSNRWDIREGGECDCSSLVIHALREAGFDTGSASYTGNLSSNLCARGWYECVNDGAPMAGDILLNHANHVAVWLGDCLAEASIDENWSISGGCSGDQTGNETHTGYYYNFPWDCYLRFDGDDVSRETTPISTDAQRGGWLGEMHGLHDTTGSTDDFAGLINNPMLMLATNCKDYQVHILGGEWLPVVHEYNINDHNLGCAGDFKKIDGIRIFDDDVLYQTKNLYGDWNSPLKGLHDTGGSADDFAGIFGIPIDCVRIWREDGEQPFYNVYS